MNARLTPLDIRQVQFQDAFWAPKLQVNREVTLVEIYRRCEETGRIAAWDLAWKPGMPQEPHIFWDSDVAKWLEAASYTLATHPDAHLQKLVDEVVDKIVRAQQADGYINTHFTLVRPEMRWANLRDWHELYCAGHLIEAAVAHFQATGQRILLDAVCKYADYIDSVFGREAGKKRGYPGHEEIELALVKLYRVTKQSRYLKLAQYFVEERGRQPHYFDLEASARGENPADYWAKTHAYTQSHVPVREQTKPVGHAVRGTYLYSAMADLAASCNDPSLFAACKRIWRHLAGRRMYITGGIGSSAANEGYTADYDLPNDTAYAETCAAIGLVFWTHRMLQIEPDSVYADVLERALYNGVLSGVSLQGDRFFYDNPLESRGGHHRWRWHRCSCCPPNLARLLASLARYTYSHGEDTVYMHLYAGSLAELSLAGTRVRITQKTDYPWDGRVQISINPERETKFGVALRLPGWCDHPGLKVNSESLDITKISEKGYALIRRAWKTGDRITLELPMPVQRVAAHPAVRQNCGRIALQRGPIVYCLEEIDHGKYLNDLILPQKAKLMSRFEPDLLNGVVSITGTALRRNLAAWQGCLYRTGASQLQEVPLRAIPYFAWDNREPGEMLVWLREGLQ